MSRTGWWTNDGEVCTLAQVTEMVAEDLDRDPTDYEVGRWLGMHGWEPLATCMLCDRPLPDDSPLPICGRCTRTAKAHARHEQARKEWEREGSPR